MEETGFPTGGIAREHDADPVSDSNSGADRIVGRREDEKDRITKTRWFQLGAAKNVAV